MRDRIARSLVRLYPHAWRVRYEDEFVAMLDARGLRWRDLADIAICAGREWMRLTSIGRALAIALEMWLTAIVWSLIVASIGSAITGVARWALGIESTLTLPFLTMDLARSFFVEVPKAIALGAAFVAPRLIFLYDELAAPYVTPTLPERLAVEAKRADTVSAASSASRVYP